MLTASQTPRMGRVMRRPQHTFNLISKPWRIQPFMIAPVLPGETMKNLLMQARIVTDPIKNPIMGWWAEHYFFYVKLRDLNNRDVFMDMFVDPTKDMSNEKDNWVDGPHNVHNAGPQIHYSRMCYNRVVECYFRNEGETIGTIPADGSMELASIGHTTWLDSFIKDSDYYRPDLNVDLNADGAIKASEVDKALETWNWMRSAGLTDQTYEDFLRSYGVKVPRALREETHWPELIRYNREWTYPSNTVDPTTGNPSSAVSWSIQERADKDRYFKEPGFIYGVQVIRPKVYIDTTVIGTPIGWMDSVYKWLPAVLDHDPTTSMVKFTKLTGPIPNQTNDYWFDIKDLFLYGDQFIGRETADTPTANKLAVPISTGAYSKYPAFSMITDVFKVNTGRVRSDGIVSLNIAGRQTDTTQTTR